MVARGDIIAERYRVDAKLGEGGMGEVWRATHLTIGSEVALKLLKGDATAEAEAAARFLREARAAGRLRGEHVCRVTDAGQTAAGQPYLVMELLAGEDLSERLARELLPPAVAARYVTEACEALAEAHAAGMIHRDIKPANLFVARTLGGGESIKVLDFGIATAAAADRVEGRLTSTSSVMGSPSYMSPEQLRSAREVDGRSDVWALGVCLYEMLSGRLPFDGSSFSALAIQIATEPHVPLAPEEAPAGLVAIVERCLAKDPAERFGDVAELAAALAPWRAAGEGVEQAVRVRRALATPVAATVMPGSAPILAAGTARAPAPNVTTLGKAAGESVAIRRRGKPWLAVGGVLLAGAAAVVAMVLTRGGEGGPAAAAGPAAAPIPAPTAEPPKPVAEPPKPVAEPPKPIADPPKPVADPPKAKPAAHPFHNDPHVHGTHVAAPPQPQPQPVPIDAGAPIVTPPTPTPVPPRPTPCRPDDPRCGL